jgi:NAD(P)-dependent dehydrogenase (short-subunit alcohol dehydrogenase family)
VAKTDTKGAAFITGGSSGIGLELARLLAHAGHPLALFARSAARLVGLCRDWPVGALVLQTGGFGDAQALQFDRLNRRRDHQCNSQQNGGQRCYHSGGKRRLIGQHLGHVVSPAQD